MTQDLRRKKYWNKWIAVRSPKLAGNVLSYYDNMFTEFSAVIEDIDERAFYEILGFGHYENMTSNLLAYLFDDQEDHGLGNLFISSWFEANGENIGPVYGIERIEREYTTSTSKRIDILIELPDRVVIIENKIYANLNNDLNDYYEFIQKEFKEKEVCLYVLSMSEMAAPTCRYPCKLITYQKFIGTVEAKLGKHILSANSKRLPQIIDYLNSIKRMANNKTIDKNFAEFCAKNKEVINSFISYFTEQTNSIDILVKNVHDGLKPKYGNIEIWRGFVIYRNYNLIDDGQISVDVIFNLTGIEVTVWERIPSDKSTNKFNQLKFKKGKSLTHEGRILYISSDEFKITEDISHIIYRISHVYEEIELHINE